MADNTTSDGSQPQIDLKVLTNTNGTLRFPDLPATLKVGDLKDRIRNELPSDPAREQMRLIYRGRILPNPEETLLNIFGVENIRQLREQSIHLVLPDISRTGENARPASIPPSQIPNPNRPNSNPFRAQEQVPRPQPLPPAHALGQTRAQFTSDLPPVIPPHIANMIGQQLAATQTRPGTHNGGESAGGILPSQAPGPPFQNGSAGHHLTPQNVFQQVIAQQQQQRAASAAGGPNTDIPNQTNQDHTSNGPQSAPSHGIQTPAQAQHNGPGNVHIHREGVDPNGSRWSFSIDRTVHHHTTNNPFGQMSRNPAGGNRNEGGVESTPVPSMFQQGSVPPQNPITTSTEELQSQIGRMRTLIEDIERRLHAANTAEGESDNLRRRLESFRSYQRRLDDNLASRRATATSNHTTSSTLPPGNSPNQRNDSSSNLVLPTLSGLDAALASARPLSRNSPEAYLINGPSGPYAILLAATGTYATAPFSLPSPLGLPSLPTGGTAGTTSHQEGNASAGARSPEPRGAQTIDLPQHADPQAQQDQRQDQIQNQDQNQVPQGQAPLQQQRPRLGQEPRGMAMAGHIWLAIRLLFFLYMFSGGSGWRRPMMIFGLGMLAYLFQIGLFDRPIDRLRRHFEGLLPLPEERRREEQRLRRAEEQGQENGGRRTPTPEEAAERLVRDRGGDHATWIRDQLRLVERAVALFVASLWPGLGERMVATREARLRQEREEEEQRERDAQAAQQTEGEGAPEEQGPGDENASGQPDESSQGKGKARVDEAEASTTATSSSVEVPESSTTANTSERTTFSTQE